MHTQGRGMRGVFNTLGSLSSQSHPTPSPDMPISTYHTPYTALLRLHGAFAYEQSKRTISRCIVTETSEDTESMQRLISLIILAFSVSLPSYGSLTINADAVRKSAIFIYPADSAGAVDAKKPLGTGFLVFVPYKTVSAGGGYLLLITARHILQPTWAGCPIADP